MNEVYKLLNISWCKPVITGDRIRPPDASPTAATRTAAYGGPDFSQGQPLCRHLLAVDYTPSDTMRGRFFADTDCWVLEETMRQSPNRPLYEQWVAQGWLHVCPGEVFDSMLAINRIAAVAQSGVNIVSFCYDPAQSIQPINQLKAWLQTLFQRTDVSPRSAL